MTQLHSVLRVLCLSFALTLILILALTPAVVMAAAQSTFFPPVKAAPQGKVDGMPLAPLGEPGTSAWVHGDQADVRLIAARTAVDGAAEVRLGLQFDLKPGWKVYWRSPGDAGYPPSVDWTGSDNLAGATIAWPAPHRFELFGIQTAGYDTQVVLPITARLSDPARPLQLRGAVDYLICSEICIPGSAIVDLTLPATGGGPSDFAHLIERYQSQVPSAGQGIALKEFTLAGETLRVVVAADPPVTAPDLFVEGPLGDGAGNGILSGAPKTTLADGGRRATFTAKLLAPYALGDGAPPLVVTVVDGGRGLEAKAVPAPAALPAAVVDPEPLGLGTVLGLALLGGLILNLMPCVLPVLSLKVMGFVGHGGAARGTVRAAFIASAAGVIASFLVLAAVLAGLKLAGTAVGWGIQFQQPLFLIGMIALLTLFAANLWGFFEVPLPGFLAGAGGGLGAPRGLAGHFTAGAFATLLATPCSAPFLGTAVGFALARGPVEIGLIFATLGLGMALPYLGIAAFPALAQRLPRPGRWMVWLRAVLGVALAGTAVWLLAVLMAQIGAEAAAAVAGLMAAVVAALALRHRMGAGVWRPLASAVVVLLVAAAFAAPLTQRRGEAAVVGGEVPVIGLWQPWSHEAVAEAVAAGKVVFVDVTADWCITCKVNKAAVIERGAVLEALRAPGVVALKADWTNPDPVIAAYLASFGRYGIPFNAVYGPAATDGIALPELLSTDVVLEALGTAAGEPASYTMSR